MCQRFVDSFAAQVGVASSVLDEPGTTVVATEHRAGSGAVACYRIGRRLVAWCDPGVLDHLAPLAAAGAAAADVLPPGAVTDLLAAAGFVHEADADMCVPAIAPPALAVPDGYHQRWLSADDAAHVDLVRAFTGRSDPAEVEEAALDDLEHFAETAIDVLVDDGPDGEHVVAYASAAAWTWDPVLADIGVLVDRAHRGRGLARFVVAECTAALLRDGRVPLYRHEHANLGSARVARSVGFAPVTTLTFHRLPGRTS